MTASDNAKMQYDLGNDKISKLLWHFGVPAIVGLVINSLYYLVDRVFIGNGVGAVGLGAVAVSYPVFILMMAVGMMVGVGGSVNFSVRLGQKKIRLAEKFMTNAFAMIIVLGALTCFLLHVFLEKILLFLGATSSILPYAQTYIRICLVSGTFYMANMVLNSFIRACGSPRYAMGSLFVGAVLNTILDPVFIFVLDKGIEGAAVATVIAQTGSFIFAIMYFVSRSPFKVRLKALGYHPKLWLAIAGTGAAQFSIQLCGGFVQTVLNRALREYGGDAALSAMGVSTSTALFLLMPVIGLCEGAQPIIGFNYGAQKFDRLRRIYIITATGTTILCVISQVIVYTQARLIALLFNPNDPEWLQVAVLALRTNSMALCTVGMQIATSLFLQATKKTRTAMFLVLSRQLLFLVPALNVLPVYYGLRGVYLSMPVSDFICFLCAVAILMKQLRFYKKAHQERQLIPAA